MIVNQMLIEYPDGMKNGYRVRDGEIEFQVADADAQHSAWQQLSESELLMHRALNTIVAAWLDNQDEKLWQEMGRVVSREPSARPRLAQPPNTHAQPAIHRRKA